MIYSTFDERIYSLLKSLPKENENVSIIIIHQVNNKKFKDIESKIKSRSDILYHQINSTGVTKSRNTGINLAKNEIILFCDDDVIYSDDLYDTVINAYKDNPKFGYITFQYGFIGKNSPAPKFRNEKFKHSLRTILSIGTIEISCLRKALIRNKIYFPEDMGAGEKYFICDEPVFLSKLYKKNIPGLFIPKIIGFHPEISSGSIFNDSNAFISRKLCFTRIFGKLYGNFLFVAFILKNLKKFNSPKSFFSALFSTTNKLNDS